VTVPSGWIVERLDVFRDRAVADGAILVDLLLDVLLLQAAEEGFGYSVIPAIVSTAHAGNQPSGTNFYRSVIRMLFIAYSRR
jgi:hypothetical protein